VSTADAIAVVLLIVVWLTLIVLMGMWVGVMITRWRNRR
jgi:hypothetical protein